MKFRNLFAALLLVLAVSCSTANKSDVIKVKTPVRPLGQENVLGLTVPAMDTVRIGFVGIGMRGSSAVERYTYVPGVKITALCDVEADRVEKAQKALEGRGFPKAAEYSGSTEAYKELCDRDDIDLVYICTDWKHHVPIALYAMDHGKNVAVEVPAAASLEDIWALVNMSEKTRKHCMMLENCCYDFYEMAVLTMAQRGFSVRSCTEKVPTTITLIRSGMPIGTTGGLISTRMSKVMSIPPMVLALSARS